jgi:hypothetical protein
MTMRVVGAGVGRTGTLSLKAALEQLLGGRCYHMLETFGRLDDLPVWEAAALGRTRLARTLAEFAPRRLARVGVLA